MAEQRLVPKARLASFPRLVLSKVRRAASRLTSSVLSKCQVFHQNPRVPEVGRRRPSSRASWRQDLEGMKMDEDGRLWGYTDLATNPAFASL